MEPCGRGVERKTLNHDDPGSNLNPGSLKKWAIFRSLHIAPVHSAV